MPHKNCCVYIHTNMLNNKKYVGITSNIPEKRWAQGTAYKHNAHFTNAIEKYGWENFKHEIIAKNLDEDIARGIEIFLIYVYQTTNKKYGYNLSTGGEPMSGVKHSEETKRKMSIAAKNKIVSEETKKKLSEIMKKRDPELQYKFAHSRKGKSSWCKGLKGKNNPCYGTKRTEEEKDKMAIADMRHFVRHIPTGRIYKSNREIFRENNISRSTLFRHCNKQVKHPKWEYIEKENYSDEK